MEDKPPDDTKLAAAVKAALETQIPNILKLERYVAIPVIVFTVLAALGILSVGSWAGKKILHDLQEEAASEAVGKSSVIKGLMTSMTGISTNLNSTFQSQVDSAAFKRLRFGCLQPGEVEGGFQTCAAVQTENGRDQTLDDQTIIIVANPARQTVRLDLTINRVPPALEGAVLQLVTGAPPVGANAESANAERLLLTPEQILDEPSRSFLRNGRIALFSDVGPLRTTIDLTPSLARAKLGGPLQLRFEIQQPVNGKPGTFERSKGRDRVFIRTITSVYHRIGMTPVADSK